MQKYAFFEGQFVPLEQAKISVMTHALNYGTGVFEGIRGYWNEEQECVYIFRLREHFIRFLKNTKMVCIGVPYSADELVDMTLELVGMHEFREDVYIRPLAYKSSPQIGVSMTGVADDLTMFASPFGNYVDIDRGLAMCVSSWKRSDDNAIPGRAKISGNYANTALIKNEAILNGYDEAVVLNYQGFVCEGSAENIFIVRDGVLITPSVADGILEGITRDTVETLALDELGVPTVSRAVARSELYYADEMFLTGTGAQVAPVTSVDRRLVGDGEIGPITRKMQDMYFQVVKGRNPKYMDWLTRAEVKAPTAAATKPAQ
ncbi:MAG: branched-chain amino acid transaminase [Chloroflexota bacterium]